MGQIAATRTQQRLNGNQPNLSMLMLRNVRIIPARFPQSDAAGPRSWTLFTGGSPVRNRKYFFTWLLYGLVAPEPSQSRIRQCIRRLKPSQQIIKMFEHTNWSSDCSSPRLNVAPRIPPPESANPKRSSGVKIDPRRHSPVPVDIQPSPPR